MPYPLVYIYYEEEEEEEKEKEEDEEADFVQIVHPRGCPIGGYCMQVPVYRHTIKTRGGGGWWLGV